MRRLIVLGFALAAAATLVGAELVRGVRSLVDGVVIAEAVLGPAADAAKADDTDRIQQALDAVGEKGGGAVFLASGAYTVSKPIIVPVGVTLRGVETATQADFGKATLIRIVGGRGDEEGQAAFTVNPGGGLIGLVFWYPEQTLENPVPYPWTIRTALHPRVANDNQTIQSCRILNAWRGIAIGPEWSELHTIRDVGICALKTGIAIDSVSDIGRLTHVTISPWVWCRAPLAGVPKSFQACREWLRAHDTVGVDFGRSDWEFIRQLTVRGYRTGVRFRKGANGLTNAVMAECEILDCETGLDLQALNEVGLAVYRSTLSGCGRTVVYGKDFRSCVQFHSCRYPVGTIEPSNRILVTKETAENRSQGAFRSISSVNVNINREALSFCDVTAFGASPALDDNASAFQKALDAAGPKGLIVYVPAGRYRFRGNIRVPKGVELRGSFAVPHHTCAQGSILMPYQGRGDENGTPFVTLEPGAGLRGLSFWYPEQTTIGPVAYPWTVRSLGRACWICNVNIGNGWQGVDFASHPSSRHFISYLSGCCWRRALYVGDSSRGWVEDLQFNPHYSLRRAPGLPVAKNPPAPKGPVPAAGWESGWLRDHLEGFVFRNCQEEYIVGTFLYAARDGLAFYGTNTVCVFIHGTDTGSRGLVLDQAKGSRLDAALMQLVPWKSTASVEKAGVWCAPTDAGAARLVASQFWAGPETLIKHGRGELTLESVNSISGPMVVHDGAATIKKAHYWQRKNAFVEVRGGHVTTDGLEIRKAEQKEESK